MFPTPPPYSTSCPAPPHFVLLHLDLQSILHLLRALLDGTSGETREQAREETVSGAKMSSGQDKVVAIMVAIVVSGRSQWWP